jgi:hypothetical protein
MLACVIPNVSASCATFVPERASATTYLRTSTGYLLGIASSSLNAGGFQKHDSTKPGADHRLQKSRVRSEARPDGRGAFYLATRHFAGWYMVNVLDLSSEDVAIALGHIDGGELVRKLYGHRDQERALDRVTAAYGQTASFTQMRLV